MVTKHTPGPWSHGHYDSGQRVVHTVSDDPCTVIAELPVSDGDCANAALIAAAPDMLAALEAFCASRLVAEDGAFCGWAMVGGKDRMTLSRAEQFARAAIAKARGE